jgi:dsDNA-specific endonuclease/ATPase MutS2
VPASSAFRNAISGLSRLARGHGARHFRIAREETAQRTAKLQPGDAVCVPRFDKPGRIVRIDAKRQVAVVSLGLGQWEVALDEVFPDDQP